MNTNPIANLQAQQVTFIVENDADLDFIQREFRMPAVKIDDINSLKVLPSELTQNLLVVAESEEDGIARLAELIAQGREAADLRFIDLGHGVTLSKANPQQVLARLNRPKDVYWKTSRSLADWGDEPELETFHAHIDQLTARWTFPDIAVFCGGYGSGKSTIAQLFGLKLAHHYGWGLHVCAWEDRRVDFRQRTWRTAIGCSAQEAIERNIDHRPAMDLERRVFWDEPNVLNERSMIEYFERVRFFNKSHGVRVFVCDPWNEFDHDVSGGERETIYVRRMMKEARALTRELGIIFEIVTHLPKGGYGDAGGIKPFRIIASAGSAEFGNKADHGFCVARTSKFSKILRGEVGEQEERDIGLAIASKFGPPKGDEHVIIAVDKVKVEPDMGRRSVFAYVLDKQANDLIYDKAATQVAKGLWDVF
ncbi:hypothetical protein [Hyphomicrobium sp.]|uniref:hypothetical protein n=1 Tax=Hyphomicrobium sp. TaxID=82 RepID=UPI000FB05118|nr:hypothetical protein [Hyphomicrobium sp.]RUO98951.1 MAG: hypothetical protein EKK30_08845 [Hyphomicrobium sp.]